MSAPALNQSYPARPIKRERRTKEQVEQLERQILDIDLDFVRIGITPEQIIEHDLPTKPRKDTDRRANHIQETVEAEAMPTRVLRSLLREHIESYLPAGALEIAKVAERSEREVLRLFAAGLEARP